MCGKTLKEFPESVEPNQRSLRHGEFVGSEICRARNFPTSAGAPPCRLLVAHKARHSAALAQSSATVARSACGGGQEKPPHAREKAHPARLAHELPAWEPAIERKCNMISTLQNEPPVLTTIFNVPGFQSLPKRIRQMLVVTEAQLFAQAAPHYPERVERDSTARLALETFLMSCRLLRSGRDERMRLARLFERGVDTQPIKL